MKILIKIKLEDQSRRYWAFHEDKKKLKVEIKQ